MTCLLLNFINSFNFFYIDFQVKELFSSGSSVNIAQLLSPYVLLSSVNKVPFTSKQTD